ncbi:uncharacterized protein ofcc1 [Gadus morhua]|uniref:uncharacterized protein ofcc1 n=1 Tax=Gadus morhua TaxID=8049 RepID=UPI0011B72934|nr:uncharacterized protein LOC115537663 [Gadus morhua]
MLSVDEYQLYQRMAELLEEEDGFIDLPGTLLAPRDEEDSRVKPGGAWHQPHRGARAGGQGPSLRHSTAQNEAGALAWVGTGPGDGATELGTDGTLLPRESAVKSGPAPMLIPCYAQQLRERVLPDMITLGSLSLQQKPPAEGLLKKRKRANRKEKITSFFGRGVKEPYTQRDATRKAQGQSNDAAAFQCRTIENQSQRVLGEGQEEVMVKYKQMTEIPESSCPPPLWQEEPHQPIDVRVRCLRAVRDKLPRGLYTVSLSLHARLGGPALTQPGADSDRAAENTTEPAEHGGRYYDTALHFNQSTRMDLPCNVVPSAVLLFRLVALPSGALSQGSSVVAWGAFPVCGASLSPLQGRFKTPLLRGQPRPQLDQFRKIEALMCSDLDHWLCNLYFQVTRLPCSTSPSAVRPPPAPPPPPPPIPTPPAPRPHPPGPTQAPPHPRRSRPPAGPQPYPPPPQHPLHPGASSRPACPGGKPWEATSSALEQQQQQQEQPSPRGSPLHLSADSACSSSSLPEKTLSAGEKKDPGGERGQAGIHHAKQPMRMRTHSCGPSLSGSGGGGEEGGEGGPARRHAGARRQQPATELLSTEELEEFTAALHNGPIPGGPRDPRLSDRTRLALRMLPSELGLPLPWRRRRGGRVHCSARRLGLIIPLLALMWFARLYLHYCSQWLFLQAMAVPVNKFEFHAHTVDLVYQNSLLHTREELALVVAGPLTLNAVTFLLVLIRRGCQQIFGSLPSFTSDFIMAQGVWTVLDPGAVLAVDAVLGRLAYSPDRPVGDAAKLYWHFLRNSQSGAAGVVITLFLYAVLLLLSVTILFIYLLRFHNDGRMLDTFQRLSAREGDYFLPRDLELSNQELSHIVKKAEQWRGFNGERRKVAVSDYIWAGKEEEESPASVPVSGDTASAWIGGGGGGGVGGHGGGRVPNAAGGELSTHVSIYTLYLSGLRQRYRHFLRQADGSIVEVIGDIEGADTRCNMGPQLTNLGFHCQKDEEEGSSIHQHVQKRRKPFWRSHRVEPIGESGCGFNLELQELSR